MGATKNPSFAADRAKAKGLFSSVHADQSVPDDPPAHRKRSSPLTNMMYVAIALAAAYLLHFIPHMSSAVAPVALCLALIAFFHLFLAEFDAIHTIVLVVIMTPIFTAIPIMIAAESEDATPAETYRIGSVWIHTNAAFISIVAPVVMALKG